MNRDVVVIGAGPAGMSAATVAAELGLSTLLLDEQPRPGGQIYRNIEGVPPNVARLLGPDYRAGGSLVTNLRSTAAEARNDTLVWSVTHDLKVTALQEGRAFEVQARQLIGATGAMERPSPIAGWTLPGVMNAGAAQIAMKGDAAIPVGRIALVGTGPLMLLVAGQLLDAGVPVVALVDTSESRNQLAALKHLARALKAPGYFAKGAKMMSKLRRAQLPWYRGCSNVKLLGDDHVRAVKFSCAGRRHEVAADVVLLHHGVIPNTQLSRLLGVQHTWSGQQQCWHVVRDAHGQTSLPGFRVAGDGAAISGAIAARASGALAALGAAHALERIDAGELARRSAPFLRELRREEEVRPFLDTLYRPPAFIAAPPDDVIVCRCEEVTAGRIREMARLGCVGPNQTKFFSRCGMGPCQGRMCGTAVTQILSDALAKPPGDVGAYRIRSPLKPIPLGAIADLGADSSRVPSIETYRDSQRNSECKQQTSTESTSARA